MVHAKAVLLVNHQQSQRFVSHILCEQRMGADDHVDSPLGKRLFDLFPLLWGLEA
ncbi:hypothetical protein SDC9_157970 [bioreactor metagenome]|uniref:Uncharacterized protein n=1 Tax=bioreactor metagenome TaxID=1076179 RepID=A0A645FE57_9ZZZZ